MQAEHCQRHHMLHTVVLVQVRGMVERKEPCLDSGKNTTSLFSWKERLRPQLENEQQGEFGREMHVHVLFS